MKIHEYQAKEILKAYKVAVPEGIAAPRLMKLYLLHKNYKNMEQPFLLLKLKFMLVGVEKDVQKRIMLKA